MQIDFEGTENINEKIMSEVMSKKAIKKLIRKEKQKEKKKLLEESNESDENIILLQSKKDLILESHLAETSYYFENGLRKVVPYYFTYSANAKGRWFNKKIVDIFCNEIQGYTPEICSRILEKGSLIVNGKKVDENYIIKNGDVIHNYVHRHELPVTDEKIEIMFEDDAVLVVNKPSSIPMHPCGRYRHNSLLYILAKENGYKRLHTIHRIDRLTSGLVIFCKNEFKAKKMAKCIIDRTVIKEYVCKVEGRFPSGTIECVEPIGAMCSKNGIYQVHPNGKYSKTVFEEISTNGITSIVKCKPLTGRTHQIRVHLQYLGFPIVNDPLYNNLAWGTSKGKGGIFDRSEHEVIHDLMKIHSSNLYLSDEALFDTYKIYSESVDSEQNSNTSILKKTHGVNIDKVKKDLFEDHFEGTRYDLKSDIDLRTDLIKESIVKNLEIPVKRQRLNFEIEANYIYKKDLDIIPVNIASTGNDTKNMNESFEPCENERLNNDCVDNLKISHEINCCECKKIYKDPTKDQLTMYLHAVKYEGPDWSYATPLPDWAKLDESNKKYS